ncbi:hypothetical protein Pcac1_g28737 [Phytophthora cactorum]|nr:hypothetical protein Pcac1_g28737 [Phytophthora cactorum]KAG2793990.1 hypothetical protein PC111_g22796 [Phytophthora cactorum]KAG3052878.1 hypothetical protein PC122_g22508 [Phytophthora cactorum]KAG3182132.1 hypothetical protein C6341_g6054 [Phytophthora cactorum]
MPQIPSELSRSATVPRAQSLLRLSYIFVGAVVVVEETRLECLKLILRCRGTPSNAPASEKRCLDKVGHLAQRRHLSIHSAIPRTHRLRLPDAAP